jgi:probable HAF family extracellular repeat protein
MRSQRLIGTSAAALTAGYLAARARHRAWRDVEMDDILGRSGGPCSRALAVNGSGTVVGVSANRPFIWSAGNLRFALQRGLGEATGIDDDGTVVGWRLSGGHDRPYVFEPHSSELPLPKGADWGRALGIRAGIVVGVAGAGPASFAVAWINGAPRSLPGLGGGKADAIAVSADGVVVGTAQDAHGVDRACIWVDGKPRALDGPSGAACAVDAAANTIAGSVVLSTGRSQACVWRDGEVHVLPGLGGATSIAHGVDDHGCPVGKATLADGTSRACAWVDGVPHDLGTLGGTSSAALGAGPDGTVVGVASTGSGAWGLPLRPGGWSWEEHAFVRDLTARATGRR